MIEDFGVEFLANAHNASTKLSQAQLLQCSGLLSATLSLRPTKAIRPLLSYGDRASNSAIYDIIALREGDGNGNG